VIKFVATLAKHPSMTHEEFVRYWRVQHVPLARELPGLRRYVISPVVASPDGKAPYDGVAELWFDDEETCRASLASPAGARARQDMERFTEPDRITRAITVEERIVWAD